MQNNLRPTKVLLYQNLGFLTVMALCYLDELLKLPSLVFSGHPMAFLFRRSTLEILFILAVWLLVSVSTGRVLKRIRYLEEFIRVCAWCRRINYQGSWMQMEDFMKQGFDTPTSHGICQECFRQQKEAAERSKKTSLTASSAGKAIQ